MQSSHTVFICYNTKGLTNARPSQFLCLLSCLYFRVLIIIQFGVRHGLSACIQRIQTTEAICYHCMNCLEKFTC